MNSNIKEICFDLENCEGITLPKEAVSFCQIAINKTVYSYFDSTVNKYIYVDDFSCGLLDDVINNIKTEWGNYAVERLKIPDITRVKITLEDNEKISFIVPWRDETRWTNILQTFKKRQGNKGSEWILNISKRNIFIKYLKFILWILISPKRIKNQIIFRWYDSIFYHFYRVNYVKISNYFYRKRKAKEGANK